MKVSWSFLSSRFATWPKSQDKNWKAHRQISKKWCFGKYCLWNQACQIFSFMWYTLTELFRKPDNWRRIHKQKRSTFYTLNHNHTKRNSLDTRAVFIEFSEYVNNSRVVVYWGNRSFSRSSRLSVALKELWHF